MLSKHLPRVSRLLLQQQHKGLATTVSSRQQQQQSFKPVDTEALKTRLTSLLGSESMVSAAAAVRYFKSLTQCVALLLLHKNGLLSQI